MNTRSHPIPDRLNLCLAAFVVSLSTTILWASGKAQSWWAVTLLAVGYAFVMNTGYALCHEAEHDMLHSNPRINDIVGSIVTLFFPASFQLRRQGHVGHHLRNRTDDEAFDLYFEGENPFWKHVQFYGILTGMFWLMIVLSNFIAVVNPRWLAKKISFDRPTAALQETLNPKYFRQIQIEATMVIALHGFMIWFFNIPFLRYFAVLYGFGFLWSTLQYIHHYGTIRDVQKGAWNLRTWRVFDLIWLNHHWHLNHHLAPTVPWIYLPKLDEPDATPSIGFWTAYLRQWKGPRYSGENLANRHAGKRIK